MFPPELLAQGPEAFEPRIVAVAWKRFRRTEAGLKVGWHSGWTRWNASTWSRATTQ